MGAVLSCFNRVQLFVTLWTITHQAPLSVGFSRQEYWSGIKWHIIDSLHNPDLSTIVVGHVTPLQNQEGMLPFKELSCWCQENVAVYGWAGFPASGEVWVMHNADTLCTVQGERRPEARELLCLKFPCLAIKCELYFTQIMCWPGTSHSVSLISDRFCLLYGDCISKGCLSLSLLFLPCFTACGIFVPWPGIESVCPAVEVQSLNRCTMREVPSQGSPEKQHRQEVDSQTELQKQTC